jgi:hypothetical protein
MEVIQVGKYIVLLNDGYRFDLGRSKYIRFFNASFVESLVGKQRIGNIPEIEVSII